MSAFALGKRIGRDFTERVIIDSPEKAFLEMVGEIREEKVEVLYILLRDSRKALLHKEAIGRGILDEVIMHPREVFYSAIKNRAHSLIVAHNHPSGDCSPSMSDIEMTHNLRTAGRVVGISVVDHLIIGREGYFSFWQKGLLEPWEKGY
jgi:DNA repair protein RadC